MGTLESLGCCSTREKLNLERAFPDKYSRISLEEAHLEKRREELGLHRLQYPDILSAFMVRANSSGFLCKEDFIAGLMQLGVRIFSSSKDHFTSSKQDLDAVVNHIDDSIYWTRFYSLFRSNDSTSINEGITFGAQSQGIFANEQIIRAGSPIRLSAIQFPTTDENYSNGGRPNFNSTEGFLNDVQLIADMRFNYKRVILGFLYLSQHTIMEKAKYMFGLLSQLRPIHQQKIFKTETKALPSIVRDDISFAFDIFITISTTYLPNLAIDGPVAYRSIMKERQQKWSTHSTLYLRSLVARFPDVPAISQRVFLERVRIEDVACVFTHQTLKESLNRFIMRKEAGDVTPKARGMMSPLPPLPIQNVRKNKASLSPVHSMMTAIPSAKGRGDQSYARRSSQSQAQESGIVRQRIVSLQHPRHQDSIEAEMFRGPQQSLLAQVSSKSVNKKLERSFLTDRPNQKRKIIKRN